MPDYCNFIDQPRFRAGSPKAYFAASIIVAIATVLRLALDPWIVDLPFIVAFPAIIVTTFICGSAAGFFAVCLSILSAWLFILPPGISNVAIYPTAAYSIGASTVVAVIGAMRAASANVRRLNETLRIGEGKFRGLLESGPDAMVIVDEHHRIALINAQTETLFGYRRAELLGQPVGMLMPERSRGTYLAELATVAADPGVAAAGRAIDHYGVRKDGTVFPIEVSLCSLRAETGILISSAIRDVTARKEIEASLAEASKAKSNFLASMSHELRTPLNAILGFAHLLQTERGSTLTAKQQEYVSHVLEGGNHLAALVGQLLDLAAIETNRLDLSIDSVNVRDTLARVHGLMAPIAEKSGVVFELSVPDDISYVQADDLRLRQVLLNLLSNAIKYNRPDGIVSLTASPAGERVRIAVSDTGIGIPLIHQKDLFQPFQRLGAERTPIDGTGIGLALSRKLIEAMNGTVGFTSEAGEGSVFWVELPVAAAKMELAAVPLAVAN